MKFVYISRLTQFIGLCFEAAIYDANKSNFSQCKRCDCWNEKFTEYFE